MSQPQQAARPYTEADVQLALSDILKNQIKSIQRAEIVYKVPLRTIRRRRDGTRSRRDCEPNSKRLTKLEEEAIIKRILEQDLQGISLLKLLIQDMADRLLRARDAEPVSKN